ncbi:hypothetical protein EMCRGX_G031281 [Ephydatia muelleri]
MSKRKVRDQAAPAKENADAHDIDLLSEPAVNIEDESESEESQYSGLDEEPDTSDSEGDEDEDAVEEDEDNELLSDKREEEGVSRLREKPSRRAAVTAAEEGPAAMGTQGEPSWREAEETDTSDEEEIRNTVGNIPKEWYEDYPHIGYDLGGKKIIRPGEKGDQLDEFLSKMDDPNYWRTVQDSFTGDQAVLTDEQLDLIEKIQSSQYPVPGFDPYEPYVDFFTHEKMIHPLSNAPEPKSRFIPSKWEAKRISKLVHAIKMGWIKPIQKPSKPKFFMLWSDTDKDPGQRHNMHIPAPKMKLPGHEESYNPPPEYLPTETEIKAWGEMDPEDRPRNFLPKKYDSLLHVPAYANYVRERFERCLDLYMCPRQRKMRVKVDPEELIPKIPKPRDLQPYPTTESILFKGHAGLVRCISVEPQGQWMASGSDDSTLKLWEVDTGRCVKTIPLPGKPHSLAFCPNASLTLLAIAVDASVYLINHGLGDKLLVASTDSTISGSSAPQDTDNSTWHTAQGTDHNLGFRLSLNHSKTVKQVAWHTKGDYLATLAVDAAGTAVVIHQISKRRSQTPFSKLKGAVQAVAFHPSKPIFFVATQTTVRVYDLAKRELVKKLMTGVKWISSIDIHPQGDNVIIGSCDKRLCWFDLDLSSKPYKILRHHRQAIRQVCYHLRYPLFASCSDDGSAIVCHGMVYNDLMQNPLLVPVKVLRGHSIINGLGVLDCKFHPTQPWLFTAGVDSTIRLFT